MNPPGTPYTGVDRRANTFGRRNTLPYHHDEVGGRK